MLTFYNDPHFIVCALSSVRGSNSTIIAYGSTGSGKTFTITGNEDIEARIL